MYSCVGRRTTQTTSDEACWGGLRVPFSPLPDKYGYSNQPPRWMSQGVIWNGARTILLVVVVLLLSLATFDVCNFQGMEGWCVENHRSLPRFLTRWKGTVSYETYEDIRGKKGSIFGKLWMKLDCPATDRSYSPRMYWEPSNISETRTMTTESQALDLLIGILSDCDQPVTRLAVRDSWMRLDSAKWGTWRAVFIVGDCAQALAEEQMQHGDLFFTNQTETYHTIAPRVQAFFNYAATVQANFTMKANDDSFIFVDRLLQELKAMRPSCLYWGSYTYHMPKTVERYLKTELAIPTSKWFIPAEQFSDLANTSFMAGAGYILSQDLVKKVSSSGERLDPPPAAFADDANTGRLIGDELFAKCSCSDHRHISNAGMFQGLELFSEDGSRADAKPCELSDLVHRTIAIHRIRFFPHMGEILSYGTKPMTPCPENSKAIAKATRGNHPYLRIWQRPIAARGVKEDVITDSDMYRTMRYGGVWKEGRQSNPNGRPLGFRPLPLRLALANLPVGEDDEDEVELNSATFNKSVGSDDVQVRLNLKAEGANVQGPHLQPLPPATAWARLSDAMKDRSWPVPWCYRFKWAEQAAEQLSQLENLGIMACDLSQESFVINVTSLDLELSAGQAWQQSRPEEPRFHTIECPLGNSQCQACYLHRGDLEMSWLPEAQCSLDTGLCPGFDFVSQARVGFHRILAPLVSPLSGMEKLDAEVKKRWLSHRPFPRLEEGSMVIMGFEIQELRNRFDRKGSCEKSHFKTISRIATRLNLAEVLTRELEAAQAQDSPNAL